MTIASAPAGTRKQTSVSLFQRNMPLPKVLSRNEQPKEAMVIHLRSDLTKSVFEGSFASTLKVAVVVTQFLRRQTKGFKSKLNPDQPIRIPPQVHSPVIDLFFSVLPLRHNQQTTECVFCCPF